MEPEEQETSYLKQAENLSDYFDFSQNISDDIKYAQVHPVSISDRESYLFCVKSDGLFDVYKLTVNDNSLHLEQQNLINKDNCIIPELPSLVYDQFSSGFWVAGGYNDDISFANSFLSNLLFITNSFNEVTRLDLPLPLAKPTIIPCQNHLIFHGGANHELKQTVLLFDKVHNTFVKLNHDLDTMTHSSAGFYNSESEYVIVGGGSEDMDASFKVTNFNVDYDTLTLSKGAEISLNDSYSDALVLNPNTVLSRSYGFILNPEMISLKIDAFQGWECLALVEGQAVYSDGKIIGMKAMNL